MNQNSPEYFVAHMRKYVRQTVTFFVALLLSPSPIFRVHFRALLLGYLPLLHFSCTSAGKADAFPGQLPNLVYNVSLSTHFSSMFLKYYPFSAKSVFSLCFPFVQFKEISAFMTAQLQAGTVAYTTASRSMAELANPFLNQH